MLGLQHETDPRWIDAVEGDLDALLVDHAHCELKAAQSALSLVGRLGALPVGTPSTVRASTLEARRTAIDALTALAREEVEHFDAVCQRINERGADLGVPPVDGYVRDLQSAARRDHAGHPALLDRILVSALIEARSCERFRLLSERLSSAELRGFYRDLMASEARHYRLFRDLGEALFGQLASVARLEELAQREAEVVRALPLGPTVHG